MSSTGEQAGTGGKRRRKGRANALVELVIIVAVALLLALGIQQFLVKPYRIPSQSMVPTLAVGQRVLVDRLTNNWSDPSRGDIVVFHPPAGADDTSYTTSQCGQVPLPGEVCPQPTSQRSNSNFIKRVVAVGGDTIQVRSNRVILNGKPQKEPFIDSDTSCTNDDQICTLMRPYKVPKGYFFMMGDNRAQSSDSRVWGPVPKKWIIGDAFFTYWPPDRIGTL